jgi:hypothetical protein
MDMPAGRIICSGQSFYKMQCETIKDIIVGEYDCMLDIGDKEACSSGAIPN